MVVSFRNYLVLELSVPHMEKNTFFGVCSKKYEVWHMEAKRLPFLFWNKSRGCRGG